MITQHEHRGNMQRSSTAAKTEVQDKAVWNNPPAGSNSPTQL